jgi:hypothetical protein
MAVRPEAINLWPHFWAETHFLLEARKKTLLNGRGCIFSRSPIVQVVVFWLVFGVVLFVPQATRSSSSGPAFEDIVVVEEVVRMIPRLVATPIRGCEQRASRSGSRGKAVIGNRILPDGHGIPATTESPLDQLAVGLAVPNQPVVVPEFPRPSGRNRRPPVPASRTGTDLGNALREASRSALEHQTSGSPGVHFSCGG